MRRLIVGEEIFSSHPLNVGVFLGQSIKIASTIDYFADFDSLLEKPTDLIIGCIDGATIDMKNQS